MRCLLTSWGSRGDLHPFLALGQGLRARGHAVTLVGHPEWATETASAGLRFVATAEPPRHDFLQRFPEVMSSQWGGLRGLHALVRKGMAPSMEPTFAALMQEAANHDVIVAHHFVFAAPAAAEIAKKPLVSVSLAPGVTPSAWSRPGPNFGRTGSGPLARLINRAIWQGGRFSTGLVVDPVVNHFRRQQGLAPIKDAVFGTPSGAGTLPLYSSYFAPPPPDWPFGSSPTGFCFYDPPGELSPEAEAFLAEGDPPILFTLGSAAVQTPGAFYQEAVTALKLIGRRGLLLIGAEKNRPPNLPDTILAVPYAPYHVIMSRARAAVHQCGIGTLSHALRAGIPSVACPFAFDQPNNARRLEALGVAEFLPPGRRNAAAIAKALERLLAGPALDRAQALGESIRAEEGTTQACLRLEEWVARTGSRGLK